MIHQIFGDMLFTPEKDCLEEFPSPESLKKRVMISTKPPKEYLKGEKPKEKGNESHEKDPSVEPWGGEIPTSLDVKVQNNIATRLARCVSRTTSNYIIHVSD